MYYQDKIITFLPENIANTFAEAQDKENTDKLLSYIVKLRIFLPKIKNSLGYNNM